MAARTKLIAAVTTVALALLLWLVLGPGPNRSPEPDDSVEVEHARSPEEQRTSDVPEIQTQPFDLTDSTTDEMSDEDKETPPDTWVRGRTVDAEGRPLPGTEIRALESAVNNRGTPGDIGHLIAESDPSGVFAFPMKIEKERPVVLAFEHYADNHSLLRVNPGYRAIIRPHEDQNLGDVVVGAYSGMEINGTVTNLDDGSPCPDAAFFLMPMGKGKPFRVRSNARGEFRAMGLGILDRTDFAFNVGFAGFEDPVNPTQSEPRTVYDNRATNPRSLVVRGGSGTVKTLAFTVTGSASPEMITTVEFDMAPEDLIGAFQIHAHDGTVLAHGLIEGRTLVIMKAIERKTLDGRSPLKFEWTDKEHLERCSQAARIDGEVLRVSPAIARVPTTRVRGLCVEPSGELVPKSSVRFNRTFKNGHEFPDYLKVQADESGNFIADLPAGSYYSVALPPKEHRRGWDSSKVKVTSVTVAPTMGDLRLIVQDPMGR